MKNRIAILDLGTNTFHILIADIAINPPVVIFRETIAVKLGEGGIGQGIINASATERGLSALHKFRQYINQYEVAEIKAVATSALRTASNGKEFLERVKLETDIIPQFISGEREAELIYLGVRRAVNLSQKKVLVIDIGGGSTECIICNSNKIFWKKSFEIGAARLMDMFHNYDPISKPDMEKLLKHLNFVLFELKAELKIHKPDVLIGSAGAFETFAELCDPKFIKDETIEFNFDLNKFDQISDWILNSNHDERSREAAIIPVRIDMIVTATVLTKYILQLHPFKSLWLSSYSLKEGLLFEGH